MIENTMQRTCVTIATIEWVKPRKLTHVATQTNPTIAMACAKTATWPTIT